MLHLYATIHTASTRAGALLDESLGALRARHQQLRKHNEAGIEVIQVAILAAVLGVVALAVYAAINGAVSKYTSKIGGL